jgi:hypothetical protein
MVVVEQGWLVAGHGDSAWMCTSSRAIEHPDRRSKRGRSHKANQVANDSTLFVDDRGSAVFRLFESLQPRSSVEDVRRVFSDSRWLDESRIHGIYFLAGTIPVDFDFESTAFVLQLFPEGANPCHWCVYFTLSGDRLPEEMAREFLGGQERQSKPTRLLQFAVRHNN